MLAVDDGLGQWQGQLVSRRLEGRLAEIIRGISSEARQHLQGVPTIQEAKAQCDGAELRHLQKNESIGRVNHELVSIFQQLLPLAFISKAQLQLLLNSFNQHRTFNIELDALIADLRTRERRYGYECGRFDETIALGRSTLDWSPIHAELRRRGEPRNSHPLIMIVVSFLYIIYDTSPRSAQRSRAIIMPLES